MDSPILQTVIGLVFIFAIFAGIISIVTEGISRFMGLRGEYLLRGIRSLVDGESDFELAWWRDIFRGPKKKKRRAKAAQTKAAKRKQDLADAEKDAIDARIRRATEAGPAAVEKAKTEAAATAAARAKAAEKKPAAAVTAIMENPLVAGSAASGSPPQEAGDTKLKRKDLNKLPSYVSSRAFAAAVLDLVIPDENDETVYEKTFESIEEKLKTIPYPELRAKIQPLVTQAKGDVEKLRKALEQWYDDHMARVSGWYKRHVRWISLGLAVVFALVFNLNAVEIGRTLYTDQSVRDAVVAQAEKAAEAGCPSDADAQCFKDVQKKVRDARNAGVPIGWATADVCTLDGANCGFWESRGVLPLGGDGSDNFWALVALILGWVLMALATVPGARFWIDSLSKLGSIRSTGPKPATSTHDGG